MADDAQPSARARPGAFAISLGLAVALAAAIRVVHVVWIAPHTRGIEDAFWFRSVASNLASGHGFSVLVGSVFSPSAHLAASAEHPPLYPLVLAGALKLGVSGDVALRSLGVAFGALTTLLVGLLARRVAGAGAGVAAATIAAIHPLLVAADGALLSETLYGSLIALTLLVAVWARVRPSATRAALLGACVGIATLTRSEALLLTVLLAIPVAWSGGRAGRPLRVAATIAAAAVVVAPWVVRNWVVFGQPLLSTNEGGLVAQTNCRRAYHGRDLGYLVPACQPPARGNEAQQSDHWRRAGLDYAGAHLGRVPVVLAVRLLREWSLYRPFQSAGEQGRSANVQKLGVGFDYALAVLAAAGWIVMRRRGAPLVVLAAPIALVSLTAIATYGSLRLREPAELSLVVLAAVALDRARLAAHRGRPSG